VHKNGPYIVIHISFFTLHLHEKIRYKKPRKKASQQMTLNP
jgi:hypothetical protein